MANRVPFPEDPEDFDKDNRVSFSKLDSKWILEDHDGSEWEYNQAARKWMPSRGGWHEFYDQYFYNHLDDAQLQAQQHTYDNPQLEKNDSNEANGNGQSNNGLKRKTEDQGHNFESSNAKRSKTKDGKQKGERKNSAIYISNLPPDVTAEELIVIFSKYGVIAENLETGEKRVKLYLDTDGKPKGDALVVYFRPESVQLAITMLDDTDLRPGIDKGLDKIRVTEADSNYKKTKGDDALKPENAKGKAKIRLQKQAEKMRNKLTEWDDDDPATLHATSSRWDKVVVLKHMFTLGELEESPTAAQEITEDVQSEASTCGPVVSVTLFDLEPDGILSIRFENPQAARACVDLMDGRLFGGLRVKAYIADGTERFKKSKKNVDDEEDEKRLEDFGDWLEAGAKDKPNVADEGVGIGAGGGEEVAS